MGLVARLSFFFLVVQLLCVVRVRTSYYFSCGANSPSYTANSMFELNLKLLLHSLAANTSVTFFYTTTEGKPPDQVYGLIECRGDIDGEVCQTCATYLTSQVAQLCPSKKEAFISFQYCLLYYSGSNFFGTVSTSFVAVATNRKAIPDPQRFKLEMASFFNKLITSATNTSATTNRSIAMYAADELRYTDQVTVYSLVECASDLSPSSCSSCLTEAVASVQACCVDKQGARAISRSCGLKYETFPFLHPMSQNALSIASPISSNCSAVSSSTFRRNLKVLLLSLIENAPPTGFYGQDIGESPDQVHGQVLCRGDISVNLCWNCTSQASTKILQLCPNSKTAVIWMDYCQLRYSDVNFAGMVDTDDKAYTPDLENASSPNSFDQTLRSLISNLSSYAMGNSSGLMFATGASMLSKSQTLYGLVQCTRDISGNDCGWCLQTAASHIARCCEGKQGAHILMGSCNIVYGVNRFFFGEPIASQSPAVALPHGHSKRVVVTISIIAGLLLIVCAFCLDRLRRARFEKLRYNEEITRLGFGSPSRDEADRELPQISLKVIQAATDGFNVENKLGEGGYGCVYKGRLPNGQLIAVKRLSRSSRQGENEFKNEVNLIAKLQHKNLVRLLGCCMNKGEKLLIYEYMPNKSLDAFLRGPKKCELHWDIRFNIIMGITRGILYLHQDSRLNIIHRDLKAGNVLLDEHMNPKISDFGMARIFRGNQGQANTRTIVGTYGYMAPEYAMDGLFSIKSDVYSFGILLLEIISGQLNSEFHLSQQCHSLVGHAWSLWSLGQILDFIDPMFGETAQIPDVLRCIHIALLCVQDEASSRPTMSSVLHMLGSESLPLQSPGEPTFSTKKATTDSTASSIFTHSEIEAR